MACNPNNSLVKRLLRQSFLLFLFVFGATTIATAETYVCSFNDFSPQQKLTQAVMVRESDKVFKDQNPTLKKVGITLEYLVYAENEKGIILIDRPRVFKNLYPSVGVKLIQKDTGAMYMTNLTGNFTENQKHNERKRIGQCTIVP
jgi:hypothetical protein